MQGAARNGPRRGLPRRSGTSGRVNRILLEYMLKISRRNPRGRPKAVFTRYSGVSECPVLWRTRLETNYALKSRGSV